MKNPIFLQKPSCNSCSPGKLGQSEYLSTKNFLSEFDTEEKRLTVLRNLGILNNQIDVVQELGDDTHSVMSQKAVTEAINNNKNIEIYESENNLPTSAETGRIAAVVYQTNNETISRLYFKNSQEWKSINDLTIVDSENKLDPSAPQGTIAVVAVNSKQTYLSDLTHPRVLKSAEDFEQLELIKTDFVINAPVSTDLDLSEELITLTFAQDYYVPKYSTSGEIQPNLPHYIYLGKFDTLSSEEAAWGIYHFSQTHGGGVIAEYDKQGNRIVYNKEAIYDLNLYIIYKNFYKYWTSYEIAPNYDIVNNFIALGQNVMTTVPYIKDVEGWTSLLSSDILYIDSDKLTEFDLEEDGQEIRITVPKDRLFEVTGGVKFEDFKNYSRICINNSIYPLLLEDGIYRTPITSLFEDNVFVQILPISIQGYNDNYYFSTSVINQELNDVKIGDDFYNLSNSAITGSIGTIQEYSDTCTLTEFYDNYHDSFPEKIQGVSIITSKCSDFNHTDIFNTFKSESVTLETYIYNIYNGKPVSMASAGPSLIIGKISGSDETVAWGVYYFSKAIIEYDYDGNQVTYDEEVLTKFNDDLHPGNTGGKVAGGYISYPKEFEIFNEIIALQHYQSRTALVVKNERGWSRYTSPILEKSIKEEHLSNELKDSLKGVAIYDSEDKLPNESDPGNIATVVQNETQYVTLSTLYQFEDSDFNNEHVDYVADVSALKEKGTKVSKIECLIPKDFSELQSWLNDYYQESSYIGLVNLDKSNANNIQYYDVYVGLSNGDDDESVYYMSVDLCDPNIEGEFAVLWSCAGPDSPVIVDEGSIKDFNDALSQGEWVYCNQPGYTNLELHDKFIKVAQEVKSTSLHLKTLDSWERINNVKIVDSIDKLDKNSPQGSLAVVADAKEERISAFSVADIDIHANPNCKPVKELRFKVPEDVPMFDGYVGFFFSEKGSMQIREDGTLDFDTFDYSASTFELELYIENSLVVDLYTSFMDGESIIYDKFIDVRAIEVLNEVMSKGAVLYGVMTQDMDNYNAPTEEQIKLIDLILGHDADVVVKGENTVFIKEDKWSRVNDARVTTKDLLPSDAEVGSIRVVTQKKREWISDSFIKRPCYGYDFLWDERIDIDVTDLTQVKGVQILSNGGIFDNWIRIDFLQRNVENWYSESVNVEIHSDGMGVSIGRSWYSLAWVEEDSYVVNDKVLNLLNETLAKGDFCIATTTAMDGLEGIISFKNANGSEIPLSEVKILEEEPIRQEFCKIINKEIFTKVYGVQISEQIANFRQVQLLPDTELVSANECIYIWCNSDGVYAGMGDNELVLATVENEKYVFDQEAVDFINNLFKDGALYLYEYSDEQVLVDTQTEELYIKRENGWEPFFSEGSVKVYDSASKLPYSAKHGTVATVASFKNEFFDIRNYYVRWWAPENITKFLVKKPDTMLSGSTFIFAPAGQDYDSVDYQTAIQIGVHETWVWVMANSDDLNDVDLIDDNGDLVEESLNALNALVESYGGVLLYGCHESDSDGLISVRDCSDEELSVAAQIFNGFITHTSTDLYVKHYDKWEKFSGGIKDGSVDFSKLNQEVVDAIDKAGITTYNSVDELPSDSSIGTVASVLERKNSLVSFADYIDTELSATLLYPETLPHEMPLGDVAIFDVYYDKWLNFRLEFKRGYDGAYWLDTYTNGSNTGPAARYVGNYAGAQRVDINTGPLHPFNYYRVTARSVSQPQVLDAFILANVPTYANPKLYIFDEDGWKQNDEDTKDKVKTLENKVEEIDAKLEDGAGVKIYNNVSQLPSDAMDGEVASVINHVVSFDYVSFSDIPSGKEVNDIEFTIPDKVDNTTDTASLAFCYLSTPNSSTYFQLNVGSYSGSYCLYGTYSASMPKVIAKYDSEGNLVEKNESLMAEFNNAIIQSSYGVYSLTNKALLDKFVRTYDSVSKKKTEIFVKNEVWEKYNGVPIIDSPSLLQDDAVDGSIASVRTSKAVLAPIYTLNFGDKLGGRQLHVVKPSTYKPLTDWTSTVLPDGDSIRFEFAYNYYIEIRLYVTVSEVSISYTKRSSDTDTTDTLAVYNVASGEFTTYNESVISTLNYELNRKMNAGDSYYQYQGYTKSGAFIGQFIKVDAVGHETELYVKNTTGWEEYGKETKDEVSALKSKVAELEATLQELLNSLQNS